MNSMKSLNLSMMLHLSLIGSGLLIHWLMGLQPQFEKVELEVIEFPKVNESQLNLNPPSEKPAPVPPKPEARQVFGATKNSITADPSKADAAEVKAGNTVAKDPDQLKLEPGDEASLPIPADEFLISSQPRLRSEVRIPYPPEAKAKGIEGPVVMDLLIDKTGRVRQVSLVRGPGAGLDEAALGAVKNFEFEPARAGADVVAVKIRYTYRFVLEN